MGEREAMFAWSWPHRAHGGTCFAREMRHNDNLFRYITPETVLIVATRCIHKLFHWNWFN